MSAYFRQEGAIITTYSVADGENIDGLKTVVCFILDKNSLMQPFVK